MSSKFGSHKKRKSGPARSFRPAIESLESRLNLAGNVVATFSGGNLNLTGDNLANELRIVGNGPGVFTVTGVGTALDGEDDGEQDFENVRNIFINFKNGDDVATFVTAELAGLLSYLGGNGNDELNFGEFNNEDQSLGRLTAIMGAGDDIVEVDGEDSFEILGAVVVRGGDGDNSFDLDPIESLTMGTVSVVNGSGFDFVDFGDTVVNARSIVINNGNGGSFLFIDGDVTIQGDLIVNAGNGNDLVNPGDTGGDFLRVSGSVVFNLGNGNNESSFEQLSTEIGGGLTITGGSGEDFIEFDGDEVSVRRSVTLVTGSGDDAIEMDSAVGTTIRGGLVINTAQGLDSITLFAVDVAGATTVNTGEGNDEVFVDNSRFRGKVTLLTLGGNDQVSIEAGNADDGIGTLFEQAVVVNLGAGSDTLNVGFDDDDFVTTLKKVVVDGGAGADTLNDSGTNEFTLEPILISIS